MKVPFTVYKIVLNTKSFYKIQLEVNSETLNKH